MKLFLKMVFGIFVMAITVGEVKSSACESCHYEITYYSNQQNAVTILKEDNSIISKKYYAGQEFEIDSVTGTKYFYVYAYGQPVAVFIQEGAGNIVPYFIHTDHLGSVDMITDKDGNIVDSMSFDVWGNRRDRNDWLQKDTSKHLIDKGFTFHSHIDHLNLINMGGRMYDPVVAQFLSPDPYVQMPENSLNFNRYSYALNSPLMYTDPTGEMFLEDHWLYNTQTGRLSRYSNLGGDEFKILTLVAPHENGGLLYIQDFVIEGPQIFAGPVLGGFGVSNVDLWAGVSENLSGRFANYDYSYNMDDLKMRYSLMNGNSRVLQQSILNYEKRGIAEPLTAANYWNLYGQTLGNLLMMQQFLGMAFMVAPYSGAGVGGGGRSFGISSLKTGTNEIFTVDNLISGAGKLSRVGGAKQGFMKGDAQTIFQNLTKGSQQIRGNLYKMSDGTYINMHLSTSTGIPTIDINRGGFIYKIRITP